VPHPPPTTPSGAWACVWASLRNGPQEPPLPFTANWLALPGGRNDHYAVGHQRPRQDQSGQRHALHRAPCPGLERGVREGDVLGATLISPISPS
jgi:hypothetical protein